MSGTLLFYLCFSNHHLLLLHPSPVLFVKRDFMSYTTSLISSVAFLNYCIWHHTPYLVNSQNYSLMWTYIVGEYHKLFSFPVCCWAISSNSTLSCYAPNPKATEITATLVTSIAFVHLKICTHLYNCWFKGPFWPKSNSPWLKT